jgi:hypothetical protein
MNTRPHESGTNHNPNEDTAASPNGGDASAGTDFAHRVTAGATAFVSQLDDRMKRNPYSALGLACAVGIGAGILLSSRLLRGVLTAAATAAAVEMARSFVTHRRT